MNGLARLDNSKLKTLLEKFAKSGNPPGTPVRLKAKYTNGWLNFGQNSKLRNAIVPCILAID
ncbi:hypothetical protein [Nostoc sp. NZL]|uniref:hypothetical protein n=1 Tax=Nostoc sp. NZL TaxID=2650612 RepID=UPI001E520942|nr:hypothetical protein [Nostoc sp. NZL]